MPSSLIRSTKAGFLWALLTGVPLTLYTSSLNRFDSLADIGLLWLYVQIPLAAAGIVGGFLIGLLLHGIERRTAISAHEGHRGEQVLSLMVGGTVAFLGLTTVRADFWYTRTYPWVDSWIEMLVVVLVSLCVVATLGVLAYLAARALSRRVVRAVAPASRRRVWIAGIAAAVAAAAAISALSGFRNRDAAVVDPLPTKSAGNGRLVLVGIDGMLPEFVEAMMAAGELPTFREMAEQGYFGELESTKPTNSPVIWTSIATGVQRSDHGVMNFLAQHPRGMSAPIRTFPSHMGLNTTFLLRKFYGSNLIDTYPVPGSFRRSATIWEVASAYGLRCGVVNWWPSWPAREINGFVVSDVLNEHVSLLNREHGPDADQADAGPAEKHGFSAESRVTWPRELADEIRERVERERWESADDVHLMDISLELARRFDPELLMIYLHGPDKPQHLYWDALEPQLYRRVAAERIREFKDEIPNAYRTADRLVGELRAQLGPDTTLLVVSDHGASPVFSFLSFWDYKGGHEHGPPGVLLAAGPGIAKVGGRLDCNVFDVAPTMLELLGIPPAKVMRGRALHELFSDAVQRPTATRPESWDFLAQHEFAVPPQDVSREKEDALRALGYID